MPNRSVDSQYQTVLEVPFDVVDGRQVWVLVAFNGKPTKIGLLRLRRFMRLLERSFSNTANGKGGENNGNATEQK